MTGTIVFSDLDGTLLDRMTYDWSAAQDALELVKQNSVPLVFCSSKTRVEQQHYQRELGLNHPCIVENGAAIVVPENYFPTQSLPSFRKQDGNLTIELGITSEAIQKRLDSIQEQSELQFRRYALMSNAEVAKLTGLDEQQAARAKAREYSETIEADFNAVQWAEFRTGLSAHELTCLSGGHLNTVTSIANSKGQAIKILVDLYRSSFGDVMTVSLGDSPNDKSMLESTDFAFQVARPDGTWHELNLPQVRRVGIGPQGWRDAIFEMLVEIT